MAKYFELRVLNTSNEGQQLNNGKSFRTKRLGIAEKTVEKDKP